MKLAVVLLAATTILGCAGTQRAPQPKPAPVERTARFRSWGHVTRGYGIDPLTEQQAQGMWHWVLRFRGEEVIEAQEISPTGAKVRRREITHDDSGTSTVNEYDVHGALQAVRTTDSTGLQIVTHRSGRIGDDECHHERYVVDEHGRYKEARCFDELDRPFPGSAGCERVLYARSTAGHIVRATCLRADGSPSTFSGGYHSYRVTVDELGAEVEFLALDLEGQPLSAGCARAKHEFHTNGLMQRKRCLTKTGALSWEARWTFNERGCRTSHSFFDALGRPTMIAGVSARVYVPNAHCETLREETRDDAGALIGSPAIRDYERDAAGRIATERCRDKQGQPVNCIGGTSKEGALVRYVYDDRDRVSARRCYSLANVPSKCSSQYAFEERMQYDKRGRERERSYFDENGNPTLALGAARVTLEYDGGGHIASKRYFGVHNEPVIASIGCHEIRSAYDEHHDFAGMECRGREGELVAAQLCLGNVCFAPGAARVAVERISTSEFLNVHYDPTGKELARVNCAANPCFH